MGIWCRNLQKINPQSVGNDERYFNPKTANKRMKYFLPIFVLFSTLIAQNEFSHWKVNYSITTEVISPAKMSLFAKIYIVTISDYDGDNCRFSPTCSNFFWESSRTTNFFEANLMFGDRFLRDINILNSEEYSKNENGFLIDFPKSRIFKKED